MRIALIEVKPTQNGYVAKEMAGGLGKRVKLGNHIFGSILNKFLTSLFNAPPIVLAQLAGVCRENNIQAIAYHTNIVDEIDKEVQIAIVLSSMVDYRNEINFINEFKKKYPHIKVIAVGSFASALPEIYLPYVDGIIKGNVEISFKRILTEGIPGSKIVHFEDPDNLDELPHLDWIPFLRNGYYARRPFSKELGVSIQKSRGCSMTCNYCPYASFYGTAKQFGSDYVFKQIEYYYNNHAIRYFMFRDPNFGENRKDFHVFMEKLIKSQLKISWSCEARLDTFKDEDLILMAQAGLRYIITGVESSDTELLKQNMRRAYKKEDAFRKINTLEKAKVIVQTNYILGFPHETEDSIFQTIEYAKQLNSMFATFHIFTPQPGTKIFDDYRLKNRLLENIDWEDFTYANLVWQHDTLSKEFLEKTTTNVYAGYYFRPQWMGKHLGRLLRILV